MRIVYSVDDRVRVTQPSPKVISRLTGEGGIIKAPLVDEQIHRHVKAGIPEPAAARYVRAACRGGLSTQEAWAVIRDRDCLGHDHVIMMPPSDRWFRAAWRLRGSRIVVDLDHARELQGVHILDWREAELKKAKDEQMKSRLLGRLSNSATDMVSRLEDFDFDHYGSLIAKASNVDELRRVWPSSSAA